jgi:hypothetical protein
MGGLRFLKLIQHSLCLAGIQATSFSRCNHGTLSGITALSASDMLFGLSKAPSHKNPVHLTMAGTNFSKARRKATICPKTIKTKRAR